MPFYNLARMYTETTGTGTVTLTTAVPGCLTFDLAGVSNAETVQYAIITYSLDTHRPTHSEVGTGTYTTSGSTLARTTVEKSTNGDAKIELTGLSEVYLCPLASDYDGFGGGGGGVESAQYSGSVNTSTITDGNSGSVTITDENWDTATLASVSGDTITFATGGTYHVVTEIFWDKPTAGTPNGVLGVRVTTSAGNHEHWEHFETADDMASNYIHMSWTSVYSGSDTITVTAYNYMGMSIRFNVREITLIKVV